MARIGRAPRLGVLVLALLIVAGPYARPADDNTRSITNTLAVQDAMRQGRDLLQRGQAQAAVEILEGQLPRINGNANYLALLREAYYAYVKELQLAGKSDQAAVYLKRLQILDKNARGAAATTPPKSPAAAPKAPAPEVVARGVRSEDDPLQQNPRREQPTGRALLPEAEKAFAEQRYGEADRLFARAYGSDAGVSPAHGSQWAYCKLSTVVARLKEADAAGTAAPVAELEQEVTAALRLAANDVKLDAFGRQVLEAVRQRQSAGTGPAAPAVTVRHQEAGADGWARAESANFRLCHTQKRDFAEQLLRAAEQARAAAFEKWGAGSRTDWKPVCEVFLYATAADYSKATGKPATSPGHSTLQIQNKAVTARRLDLRADEPGLLGCVLPHETTHLVLADLFADAPLPRWADEGIAVLAEPRGQLDRYMRTLHRCRQQGQLVALAQLLHKADYADAAHITAFYVESVSVVEFLVAEKGPRAFVQFLRDVPGGLDTALQKHYGCPDVADLQNRWLTRTFAEADARSTR